MTLSHLSKRVFIFAGAAMLGVGNTVGIPMAHAASGPYFQAELAKPAPSTRMIMRGTSLKCEGNNCRAKKASTSAKNMCVSIAREFGEVTAFRAGKREFDTEALAKCNGDKRAQAKIQELERLASN